MITRTFMRRSVTSRIKRPWQKHPTLGPPGQITSIEEFAADVRRGLTKIGQKELYSKYFYDDVGSALFEAITVLPEYGLTRADERLLRAHSADFSRLLERPSVVIELGSGTGSKTGWILSALAGRSRITYCPIDISVGALGKCSREVGGIPNVQVVPFAASYLDGLGKAVELRPPGTSVVVLFLGSTIGNFEADALDEFLGKIRNSLTPGDVFYLSTDLVKNTERMLAAYDDELGVTAAFNLNLLARINRELGGNFKLSRFQHQARYVEDAGRIEMHLSCRVNHAVTIGDDLVVDLKRGETIWTENSYKFWPEDVVRLAERTGFTCEVQWIDSEWPFAQSVLRPA